MLKAVCVRVHYRVEATMCRFPTALAFFPILSEANVAGSLFNMLIDRLTLWQKFITDHAFTSKNAVNMSLILDFDRLTFLIRGD